ncbi:MAG: hypothetical protein N2B06_07630 [Clostridium sp.]
MTNLNKRKEPVEHQKYIDRFLGITNSSENKYARAYGGILELDCDSTLKLLIIVMIDDARLNKGWIKWAQNTYADKLCKSRNSIHLWFKRLEEEEIIIPSESNKAGGRKNKHVLDLHLFIKKYSKSVLQVGTPSVS